MKSASLSNIVIVIHTLMILTSIPDCPDNCASCTIPQICVTCNDGFFVDGTGCSGEYTCFTGSNTDNNGVL